MDGPTLAAGGSVAEHLADEMVARWARGDRVPAEEFLARLPTPVAPADALDLVAEELALRQEYGLPVSADAFAARFPAWAARVRALVTCHEVLAPAPAVPGAGDTLGDFRLLSELGRGAHGRVFLATQRSLGGRPVVLKLSPIDGREHLSLARLQHTHIVPLYSVHEFPAFGLRGLCLPYFGGVTLDRLRLRPAPLDGADLLAAARAADESAPLAPGERAWTALGCESFADAVCRIGACLADALQFAHDHGLLHLDVKPSNVLLAADGVPMLLDFHLARGPLRAGDPPPPWLGGSHGYMPPEQVAALDAVKAGAPVPAAVDGRADVYGLGVVLSELLAVGGARVPVGLSDVLTRCVAPDPTERYPTAADLAADLRRHLAALPLRGVANRSPVERWRKWRRRRPTVLPVLLAFAAVVAVSAALVLRADRQADGARTALARGEEQLARGRFAEAVETLRGGEGMLDGVAFHGNLRGRLRDARARAEQGRAADELHDLCEQLRPLYDADLLPPERARAIGAQCRAVWDRRAALLVAAEGEAEAARCRVDLLDLAVLTAHLDVTDAAARRRGLAILDEAEILLGGSAVLDLERARHLRALGRAPEADTFTARASTRAPRTAWEHLLIGRAALAAGDRARGEAAIERAVALDPMNFWANYHFGACRLRAGDAVGALAAFSACAARAPGHAWCLYNRGLAYAALGRLDEARADYDRALALDPALGAVPGFTRGLDFMGDFAFVGLSQAHETALFSGTPITNLPVKARCCGLWVVDLRNGQTVAFLRFGAGVPEVLAVRVLPSVRFPDLTDDVNDETAAESFVLPASPWDGSGASRP